MSRYDIASEPTSEQIVDNYRSLLKRIRAATGDGRTVKLVSVSKKKSPAALRALYDIGQREFGENYVQELVEKAAVLPKDISWHFIGHLQSNKVKGLLEGVENLGVVQSVDSELLASKLDKGCLAYRGGKLLDVYIQVNTSGEATKSGTEPGAKTIELAKHISAHCPRLRLKGLMTIGMPDYTSRPENFTVLLRSREEVAESISVPVGSLDLSMGMSEDFEKAILMGSTVVRVGSLIFGQRCYPAKSPCGAAES